MDLESKTMSEPLEHLPSAIPGLAMLGEMVLGSDGGPAVLIPEAADQPGESSPSQESGLSNPTQDVGESDPT
jgi:hypothetical protein